MERTAQNQHGCTAPWLWKLPLPALPCGVHFGLSHYWKYIGPLAARGRAYLPWPMLALQNRTTHEAGGQESRVKIFPWNKNFETMQNRRESREELRRGTNNKIEVSPEFTSQISQFFLRFLNCFSILFYHKSEYSVNFFTRAHTTWMLTVLIWMCLWTNHEHVNRLISGSCGESTRQELPQQAQSKEFENGIILTAWSGAYDRGQMPKAAGCKTLQCIFLLAFSLELAGETCWSFRPKGW